MILAIMVEMKEYSVFHHVVNQPEMVVQMVLIPEKMRFQLAVKNAIILVMIVENHAYSVFHQLVNQPEMVVQMVLIPVRMRFHDAVKNAVFFPMRGVKKD